MVFRKRSSSDAIIQKNQSLLVGNDEALVRQFLADCVVTRNMKDERLSKYASILCNIKRLSPCQFGTMRWQDVIAAIAAIQRTTLSKNTKRDYILTLKVFLKWMRAEDIIEIPPAKISEIKVPRVDTNTSTADDILTPAEIQQTIDAANTTRDKALIAVTFESCARVGEVAHLRWRDIVFDTHGCGVHVPDSKNDQRRYARLVDSAGYLMLLRDSYPVQPVPADGFVFVVGDDNRQFGYAAIYQMLRRLKMRHPEIVKKIYKTHGFRRSGITRLANEGYNESYIKELAWANQKTTAIAHYVKIGQRDIDRTVLARHGIEQDTTQQVQEVERCPNCRTVIPRGLAYCPQCHHDPANPTHDRMAEMVAEIDALKAENARLTGDSQRLAILENKMDSVIRKIAAQDGTEIEVFFGKPTD